MMHMVLSRGKQVVLLVCVGLICGCPKPKQIKMEGETIGMNQKPLLTFSPGVETRQRQFILLGGQQLKQFELTLTGPGPDDAGEIRLLGPDEVALPDELQLGHDGQRRTINVPSDAVIFSIDYERTQGKMPPDVQIHKVVLQPSGALPAPETTRQQKMKSFPIRAYEPVDLLFPSEKMYYNFTYNREEGVGEGDFDIIVHGPATVRAFVQQDTFYAEDARAFATADGNSGGFTSLRLDGEKLPLLLRVSNDNGSKGHVRLYIGKPLRRFHVTLDLIGQRSDFGGNINDVRQNLTDTLRYANYYLYQATAGRVRIDGVTARIRRMPPGPNDLPDGVVNDPDPGSASTTYLPGRPMRFPMSWWRDSDFVRGLTLAHELLHQRFNLPDEYAKLPDQPPICHNTMMGDGQVRGELCWSGNHKRTNPDVPWVPLSAQSGWGKLAEGLGIPEPTRSPPQVLLDGLGSLQFPADVRVEEVQIQSPGNVINSVIDDVGEALDNI